ncbi:Zinc finger protein GLI1, partial [Colletotrichum chlorophyti]
MEMDHTKQSQLASLARSEHVISMRGSSNTRSLTTTPMPWGLMEFYGGEQPWVPPGIFPDSQQARHSSGSGIQRRGNVGAFTGWRSNQASECDTVPPGFPPSDSGYESRTKQSIENTSVFNDVDPGHDTQSLSGRMMDLHPFHQMAPSDAYHRDASAYQEQWNMGTKQTHVAQNGAVDGKLICPGCQAVCKTKSELNKHNQRHRKAHICDVPGCNRKEGFGTMNDLDRHRSSVHPEVFSGGLRYRCHLGQCITKKKIWPRADNFRQHLKRVHQRSVPSDDDISEFILQTPSKSQEHSIRQNAQDDLEGVGSDLSSYFSASHSLAWDGQSPVMEDVQLCSHDQPIVMDLVLDPSLATTEDNNSNEPLMSSAIDIIDSSNQMREQNSSGDSKNFMNPSCKPIQSSRQYVRPREISKAPFPKIVAVGRTGVESEVLCAIQPSALSVGPNRSNGPDGPRLDNGLQDAIDEPPANNSSYDTAHRRPRVLSGLKDSNSERDSGYGQMAHEEQHLGRSLLTNSSGETLNEQDMLEFLSKMPKSLIENFLKSQKESISPKSTTAPISNAESQHGCPHFSCRKTFNRKCELKKHMKRHDKPYGCTFLGCKKKFGSKNDWKRHENSQHFQLEVWKCLEKRADDDVEGCGKVCHRRETFRSHLQKEHKIGDAAQVEQSLEKYRVGRNCESRFWCGFCVKIVEVTKQGINAWAERFNHIDSHYTGRDHSPKKDISEWKHVDPEHPDAHHAGSVDDSSDADSGDECSVIAAPCRPSSPAKPASIRTKKRSLHADDLQTRPKRLKNENSTYMWYCCKCNWDAGVKLHAACVNCSHVRCNECSGNCFVAQDDKPDTRVENEVVMEAVV